MKTRILLNCFMIWATALQLYGCRTTSVEDHVLLNSSQSDGVIYSTNDERSAMSYKERVKDLNDLKSRLTEHVSANRDDLNALGTLAQVHVALGELNPAENLCRTMLRKDLKNSLARKILGQIALRRGQYDLALIHLSNIGGVQSKDASVINMIAQIELQKGHNSTAMALFKKAVRLDPNDNAARLNLAVLYIKHRQIPLASIELERVLKSEPNNIDAKVHLAIVMLSRQDIAQAKDLLEDVLELDPDNPIALFNMSVAYRMEKEYDTAIDYLKKYIASKRGKPLDNDQAFALMHKIQKAQAAQGESVSDDEIQEMADDIRKGQNKQAKAGSKSSTNSKVAQKNVRSTPTLGNKSGSQKGSERVSESEEIDDLERELK